MKYLGIRKEKAKQFFLQINNDKIFSNTSTTKTKSKKKK